ncbi:hypothetical protein Q9295_08000 [Xinfangfangia sp. CPCC 101601]|uniref:Lipoprotein n=1 Tax=Pseudogemmobacter lacusdianii TaxID=3069608 RepID=A0ABU0VX41_9RHOB|nr:hypothetical protein [Xinfangfangia sp. CPCC 101601]MDQ2066311.1 hypothetical protein [Xinfangfangia sp. CPCC 101601]
MVRFALALFGLLTLAACGGVDNTYAPQEKVDAARYVEGPPTYIVLYTGVNDRNGSGAHSALLINASQRVLFDPAGSYENPNVPVQGDVHYGITDAALASFTDFHARDTATEKFHIIERKLYVSPQTAELILQRVQANGPVPKAQCANSISGILRGVPGFEGLKSSWFPIALGESFGKLPGVQTRKITEENDGSENHNVVFIDKDGNPTKI